MGSAVSRSSARSVFIVVALLLSACGPEHRDDEGAYLDDAGARRAALLASLENPDNAYSRQRIGAYGLGRGGWDLLPVWNPRAEPVAADDPAVAALDPATPELWDGVRPTDRAGWIALGRKVFFGYPLRAEPALAHVVRVPEQARALGIERAADGTYPGLRRFEDVDGILQVGITCALCHTTVRDGDVVAGAARRSFDFGALLTWHADTMGPSLDPAIAARMRRWGPGRADITLDPEEDPVAIPDLWGLAHQSAITQGATLRQLGPISLALRQETQLIEANHQRVRPPRELAWALAMYVGSLEPPVRPVVAATPEIALGERLFASSCRRCHHNAVGGGDPVAASEVGTQGALARGQARGTGMYRPPALLDLAHAAPYLHDGSVMTLHDLLSGDRLRAGYVGPLGIGPVPGHEYGLGLSPEDRSALTAYLLSR